MKLGCDAGALDALLPRVLLVLTMAAAPFACAAGDETGGGPSAIAPGSVGIGGGGVGGGDGAEAGADAPLPPVLEKVYPVAKILRIDWSTQSPCDAIVGERKTESLPYAVAFTAAGTDTSYLDGEAIADATYTYRLRCKLGGAYSDWSDDRSANPTQ